MGSTSIVTDATGNVISDTKYKAWGEERYTSGSKQTPYSFTGQYGHQAEFGLLFYNSRYYDPSLSRFTSADSIVPAGVQGLDRYAYVNNSPVNYTDPSGHCAVNGDNWCSEENGAIGMRKFNIYRPDNVGLNEAEIYMETDGTASTTYVAASIGVQNPVMVRPEWLPNDEYTGEGLSKVTDMQMNAPLGDKVPCEGNPKNDCGPGLGLFGEDQNEGDVAVEAMRRRISLATDACSDQCTPTDIFLIAALAENGPGFLAENAEYMIREAGSTMPLDWEAFLNGPNARSNSYNQMLIRKFATNVIELGTRGWYVPTVDWSYVYSISKIGR